MLIVSRHWWVFQFFHFMLSTISLYIITQLISISPYLLLSFLPFLIPFPFISMPKLFHIYLSIISPLLLLTFLPHLLSSFPPLLISFNTILMLFFLPPLLYFILLSPFFFFPFLLLSWWPFLLLLFTSFLFLLSFSFFPILQLTSIFLKNFCIYLLLPDLSVLFLIVILLISVFPPNLFFPIFVNLLLFFSFLLKFCESHSIPISLSLTELFVCKNPLEIFYIFLLTIFTPHLLCSTCLSLVSSLILMNSLFILILFILLYISLPTLICLVFLFLAFPP